jgi:hypothetical protein
LRQASAALGALALGLAGAGCSNGDDSHAVEFVQRPDSRLIKVQSVGLAALGPINPHAASADDVVAAFGDPPVIDETPGRCLRRWPRLGLTIVFSEPDGDQCGGDARVGLIRVSGRAAADAGWRTAEGIRPQMPAAAMRRIYPEPRRLPGGALALVEPPAEVGGGPVLVVAVERGRVAALAFPIREAEEGGRPG